MSIIFSITCGFLAGIVRDRKKYNFFKIAKIMVSNVVVSLLIYLYYFGDSNQSILNVLDMYSINMAFVVISIIAAIFYIGYCRLKVVLHTGEKIFIIPKSDRIYFVVIILLALFVRIVGYKWGGEGSTFLPDEGKVFYPGMSMAVLKTFMSDQINYPSHISHKTLSLIYRFYLLLDGWGNIKYTELGCVYLARIYIAIISTMVVAMIYFIGNDIRNNSGKYAALLAALFSPFISSSHCITGDPVVSLCFCVAMLLGLRYYNIYDKKGILYLIGMALCASVATLEKYHGMVICGLIAIVVVSKEYKDLVSYIHRLLLEGIISVSAYCIFLSVISPNLIFGNLGAVYDQLYKLTNDYDSGITFFGNMSRYMSWFFSHAGILSIIFIVVALYTAVKNKNKKNLVLSVGIVELIGVAVQNRGFIRWAFPFYICLLLLIAIGIVELKQIVYYKRRNSYKCAILIIEFFLFSNFFAGAVLTETLYVKSNMNTINVSEKWFLELGVDPDDCLQTRYTCWNPGGVNKYDVVTTTIKTNLMIMNDCCYVKRLGKKYAVNNESRFSIPSEYLPYFSLVKIFEPEYEQSMLSFGLYDKISLKVLEPYSIYEAIKMSANMIMEKISTGQEMYIYDISGIPAYAEFTQEDFEENVMEKGQMEYSMRIPAILHGEYMLVFDNRVDEDIRLIIYDEKNNVVIDEKGREKDIRFCIQQDSKDLHMKLILPPNYDFEKINIIQK